MERRGFLSLMPAGLLSLLGGEKPAKKDNKLVLYVQNVYKYVNKQECDQELLTAVETHLEPKDVDYFRHKLIDFIYESGVNTDKLGLPAEQHNLVVLDCSLLKSLHSDDRRVHLPYDLYNKIFGDIPFEEVTNKYKWCMQRSTTVYIKNFLASRGSWYTDFEIYLIEGEVLLTETIEPYDLDVCITIQPTKNSKEKFLNKPSCDLVVNKTGSVKKLIKELIHKKNSQDLIDREARLTEELKVVQQKLKKFNRS